jgi:hypothetical protein
VVAAVAPDGRIATLDRGTVGRPDVLQRRADRLRPQDGHFRRKVDLRFVGKEVEPLDQIAGKFAEPVAVEVAAEVRADRDAEAGVTVRRGIGRAMLQREVDHLAHVKVQQVAIGEVRRREQHGQHPHGRLHFRVGHLRQIDQAFDRPVREVAPHLLVLNLDLLARGMR